MPYRPMCPEPEVQVGPTEMHQAFRYGADMHNSICFGGPLTMKL